MATYYQGRLTSERNHTPYETPDSEIECKDCCSSVSDVDEEYCRVCGDPLCLDCSILIADEAHCVKCAAAVGNQALVNLQNDPDVGEIFVDWPIAA